MVGHVNLEEQVDADFSRARRKAFLRRIGNRLRKDPDPGRLPCFEETERRLGAQGGIRLGRRTVPTERIAGSVGRCSDFDEAFLPIRAGAEERWKRIDRIFHRGEELPPVSLYEIGGSYFVLDGNHRVSVYRYHGVEWIDAEVTRFYTRLPKDRRSRNTPMDYQRGRKETEMREMMDLQVWKRRRQEMRREVEHNRLDKALRGSRKRRGAGRVRAQAMAQAWALAWELERIAGRLLKLSRSSRSARRNRGSAK
jgi:hypothetical protein